MGSVPPTVVGGRRGYTHTWWNVKLFIIGKWRAWAQHVEYGRYGGRLNRDNWGSRRLWRAGRRCDTRGSRDRVRWRGALVKSEGDAGRKQEHIAVAEAMLARALALHMEAIGAAKVQDTPLARCET
jgi:hypothetical protein